MRSEHSPFRIEPEVVKITEDGAEISSANEFWGVLQEREAGSYQAKTFGSRGPEIALVGLVLVSAPGPTEWLAGEASRNDINQARVAFGVGGEEILDSREDWRLVKRPVADALREDSTAVEVSFDVADDSPAEDLGCPDSASGTGEEGELERRSVIQHHPD